MRDQLQLVTCTHEVADPSSPPLQQISSFSTAQVQHVHLPGAAGPDLLQDLPCEADPQVSPRSPGLLGSRVSATDQDALQPVVEVPQEENSAPTSSSQADFLQAVVVTGHLHAVISHLTGQHTSASNGGHRSDLSTETRIYQLLGGRFLLVVMFPLQLPPLLCSCSSILLQPVCVDRLTLHR